MAERVIVSGEYKRLGLCVCGLLHQLTVQNNMMICHLSLAVIRFSHQKETHVTFVLASVQTLLFVRCVICIYVCMCVAVSSPHILV